MAIKSRTYKIGGYSRTVVTETSKSHYKPNRMTGNVYGGGKHDIKTKKSVITQTPRRIRTKTTTYSPVDYYGKQKKMVRRTSRKF